MSKISALDVFAGAGGFSLGLKWGGIEVTGAIEIDRFAAETFRFNHRTVKLVQDDIRQCSEAWLKGNFSGVDLLAGGPPCQGFSVAGPSQYKKLDERNGLILEMIRAARVLKPEYIILENVKGILNGKLKNVAGALNLFCDYLMEIGYKSRVYRLQAAQFGVPQSRERIFVIAAYKGSPLPNVIVGPFGTEHRPFRTAAQALSDLPTLLSGEGQDGIAPYATLPNNEYQRFIRHGSAGVFNHEAMKHTKRIIERLKHIAAGSSLKDAPVEHGQRRRNSDELDTGQRFKMNCTRLEGQAPALALPANFQTIHVHPVQNRMLTAREGARIQSFPDTFVFKGPRTLMSCKLLEREGRQEEIGLSQYNQIGNAVPPLLAQAIAEAIMDAKYDRCESRPPTLAKRA